MASRASPWRAGLRPADIDLFVHGFTVGTNAFLTRNGAKVALVVTKGFRDILVIGSQSRPDLYSLTSRKPEAVVPRSRTIEVDERIDAFGNVVTPLTESEAARSPRPSPRWIRSRSPSVSPSPISIRATSA